MFGQNSFLTEKTSYIRETYFSKSIYFSEHISSIDCYACFVVLSQHVIIIAFL